MPSAILYREGITKTPGVFIGGVKEPYRSMRASWVQVTVQIDDSTEIALKQSIPQHVEMEAGPHTIVARGKGFNTAQLELHTDVGSTPVIVISPQHRQSVTNTTPLGTLVIHEEGDLRQLQPYAFYKGLPTSIGTDTVIHSVVISMMISMALFLAGLGLVALIPIETVARGVGVGAIVLVFGLLCSSLLIPAGLGGILIGLRFLKLPLPWRRPSRTS